MNLAETCATCRFDARDWTIRDLMGSSRALGLWWHELVRWIDPVLLARRPAPEARTVLDLAQHTLGALGGANSADPWAIDDLVGEIRAAAEHLAKRAETVDPSHWQPDTVGAFSHAIHLATHDLSEAGRALHALGAGPATVTGRVVQLSVSDSGVPKLPVRSAAVGKRGLDGDRQGSRQHHGRPWQALCLWSAEVVDRLRAEGHPIGYGKAGENITVSGVDWKQLRPGVRLRIGTVLAETSVWALPCFKNAQWFKNRDVERMHHDRERGVSRIYAWVREDGVIRTGDPVVVEPA